MEAEVPPRHRVRHLDAGADPAVHLGVGKEVDVALTELLVVLGHLDEAAGQVLHTDLGDRVAIALHGEHALGLERHGADHRPHATAGMGQHVAVVLAFDEDHLLPLHRVRREEVEVDAERLVTDLGEHVLMLAEFAVDPLPLHDGARVVLDLGSQLTEPLPGQIERRLERMHADRRGTGITGIGIALGDVAVGDEPGPLVADGLVADGLVAGSRLGGNRRLLAAGLRQGQHTHRRREYDAHHPRETHRHPSMDRSQAKRRRASRPTPCRSSTLYRPATTPA